MRSSADTDREPRIPPAGSASNRGRGVLPVVERNVQALLKRQEEEDAQEAPFERLVFRMSQAVGSLWFLAVHAAALAGWLIIQAGWTSLPRFDPALQLLGVIASVECLLVTVIVLIRQNRMQRLADRRSELNLHISLVAEHEATRLIELVSEVAKQVGAPVKDEGKLADLLEEVKPEELIDELEKEKASKHAPEAKRES
jgi:uncharacterized membrane protein